MKKISLVLLLIIVIFSIGCSTEKIDKKEPFIHQYELVGKHLYNKDIEVTIPVDGGKYVLAHPYFGIYFINFLDIDEYVKKVNVRNVHRWINSKIDNNTIIINSTIEDEKAIFFINENGQVISRIDDKLYISEEGLIDYKSILEYHTDKEFNYFRLYNYIGRDGLETKEYAFYQQFISFGLKKGEKTFGWYYDQNRKTYLEYEEGNISLNKNKNGVQIGDEHKQFDNFVDALSYIYKHQFEEGSITQEEYDDAVQELFNNVLNEYKTAIYQEKYYDLLLKKDITMIKIPVDIFINEKKELLSSIESITNADQRVSLTNRFSILCNDNLCICEQRVNLTYDYYLICSSDYINMEAVDKIINYSDEELNNKYDTFKCYLEELWEEKF